MRAVIFDLDGTLLDGREGIYWQYEQLTREFDGASASRSEIAEAMHGTVDQVARRLVKNTEVPFERIQERHDQLIAESLVHWQLYDGVTELLPILRRIGVRVGAVTSGNHHTVGALESMGIKQYFDIVISAKDVSNPKPHPEGIEMVLTHMDVPAHEAAMVGDTTGDILAGKNANLAKTIGVTHGFGQFEELHEAGATHIVDDIPSLLDVLDARVES